MHLVTGHVLTRQAPGSSEPGAIAQGHRCRFRP